MRSQRHKLERIDIDELFSSPVNRGMLSFLERPPEEAQARLREKQKVNAIDAGRIQEEGDSPPGHVSLETGLAAPVRKDDVQTYSPSPQSILSSPESNSHAENPGGNLPPVGNLTTGELTQAHFSALASEWSCVEEIGHSNDLVATHFSAAESCPESDSIEQLRFTPRGELPPVSGNAATAFTDIPCSYPQGKLTSPVPLHEPKTDSAHGVSYPVGKHIITHWQAQHEAESRRERPRTIQRSKYSQGKLPRGQRQSSLLGRGPIYHSPDSERANESIGQPEILDGSVVGRRQKVRRAIVAQDGHSSGEQLLYQALWNAGRAETPETRVLSIGYSGMSALCKLEKSNCKKNIQGLIQKLAVEITEPHQSVSSTGTTYRVFSYKEILRRREAAGMVWVVRTSGVRFVNLVGSSPTGAERELPPEEVGKSPLPPVSNMVTGAEGNSPRGPQGKTPTLLERDRNKQENLLPSASESIGQLCTFVRSQIAQFDAAACRLLWRKCREAAPDCTIAEVIYCFDLKSRQLFNERVRNVANPVGLMIWSVPKMFEGPEALYLQRRRAKADEATMAVEAIAQFERNRVYWQTLADDPSTSEDDRKFYRKLLGHSDL